MDPAKMKVVDLRSELGALGLDTKGNKPALVERLKKALEGKTGKVIADTTILDTSTEDNDEPPTPRRPGPASRTIRRSSSSRLAAATPAKQAHEMSPEPIEEEANAEEAERESSPPPAATPAPVPVPKPESEPVQPAKEPAPAKEAPAPDDVYSIDDERSRSPVPIKEEEDEPMEVQEAPEVPAAKEKEDEVEMKTEPEEGSEDKDTDKKGDEDADAQDKEQQSNQNEQPQEMTEEEEWEELNERLKAREEERLERERKQAEEDARRLEEVSKDPVKLKRLRRKQEKKQRWSNFYKSVEVTNEVLSPPVESDILKGKKDETEQKMTDPELNDEKITLSWYDSDLDQYLELPGLSSVTPLSDGALAHAWAGARASHGVTQGRVCYEVRVGDVVTTSEIVETESAASGLRLGWSTDDSTLHLGEGETSWGFESSARAVHNGEFKDYGVKLLEKDVVGVYLDLESSPCKISYTVNGIEHGVAYEFEKEALGEKALFPHVLTKNMCYTVNFGHDRYNMLTKTRIVRNRLEIPVEEVIEQKKKIEAELKRQKEEVAQKENERCEKEKKEREESQRKKNEEKEKQERERNEREKARAEEEKKDNGEDETENQDKEGEEEAEVKVEADTEENAEKAAGADGVAEEEQPKENGDKEKNPEENSLEAPETEPTPAVKEEAMDTACDEPADDEVKEVTEEQVLQGHVLDKRIKFVTRYTVAEELEGAEAALLAGYELLARARLQPGPRRPGSLADCEVILMVGMPGAGKTHWARAHAAAHAHKRYNLLSTAALFDRMKVDCKPFRASYEGRWDAMVSKCAKSVLKLLELAKGRRRNFILDQTNVYPSAQRRKLKELDGYRRVAVVIITDEETYKERQKKREETDGKEVPDGAIVDMKANFALPEKCSWLDEVLYPELDAEQAKAVVEAMHKEARAAGVHREREKRDRSPLSGRDQPTNKRSRDDRRHRDDRRQGRDFPRDREDRWGGGGGGGGGGGRWGGPGGRGGGGSRWGGRDRSGGPPNAPPGRFDRGNGGGGWGGPGRNDFNRERDDFRGGRGGGRGGPRGGGRGGERGGSGGPPDRFRGPDRGQRPPQDKRPNAPGGGNQGSWQRGGAAPGPRARPPGPLQRAGPGGLNQKDGPNQNQGNQQQNQQGWNQWAGGWGGWGNWNQQQQAGWGNWNNWNNWNQNAAGAAAGASKPAQPAPAPQWGAYTPQQWYQWQQWQQQQQQGWPGQYQQQQQQQGQQTGNAAAEQAWAQYYQSYGSASAGSAPAADKK